MNGDRMGPVVSVVWEDWADQSLPLPTYQTAGAAGADLCANFPADVREVGLTLAPMARAPSRSISLTAAMAVPPVAIKSSTISTCSPAATASLEIAKVIVEQVPVG
mgnify:CR=1 FL=1